MYQPPFMAFSHRAAVECRVASEHLDKAAETFNRLPAQVRAQSEQTARNALELAAFLPR